MTKDLKLPPAMEGNVIVCMCCNGEGQYKQLYNYGCGMGSYYSLGPCDVCGDKTKPYLDGTGFVYADGAPIPKSVVNQILVYNERLNNAHVV